MTKATKPICFNCETEAAIVVKATESHTRKVNTFLLCRPCFEAFEWGYAHGEDRDEVETETVESRLTKRRASA